MNYILIGFKSCGKTTIGRLIAKAFDKDFIDTDELMLDHQQQNGSQAGSIRELYEALGEASFRDLESTTISTLKNVTNSIIATGGGTPINANNVSILKKLGQIIYLQQCEAIIKQRLATSTPSAFINELTTHFDEIYQGRDEIYSLAADNIINIADKSNDEIIELFKEL